MGMDSIITNDSRHDQPIDWVPLPLACVEYLKGDSFGKLLAAFCVIPYAILFGFVAVIFCHQDSCIITFFIGILLNGICNKILKHILREPRPLTRSTNTLHSEYGMPSSHSQFMWFFASYMLFVTFIGLQRAYSQAFKELFWRIALAVSCISIACIVSYSRIYLQYHTWKQVICGALLGIIIASIWYTFINNELLI